MTAYSFGNRWVGIVGLGTPPPPEPLHKMALRLRQKALTRKVRIDKTLFVRVDPLLDSLAEIRLRAVISGLEGRSQECLQIERMVRSGRKPKFRPWLQEELIRMHAAERTERRSVAKDQNRSTQQKSTGSKSLPEARIVPTEWANSYPQAPDSPWLPPASPSLLDDLRKLAPNLDEGALQWVRWSCLHRSYLYESIPESPISGEALDLLAELGKGWLRSALLDRVRTRRGDFTSGADVSAALIGLTAARAALGAWVTATDSAFYGKGEASLMAAGKRSVAPDTVALQILGALSLVTASQAPADRLLDLISFEPEPPEPDWITLVFERKREPKFTRTETGPDHNKLYTVTLELDGFVVSGTGESVKVAKKQAARSYVLRHMPRLIPATPTRPLMLPKPLPYRRNMPQHELARDWAQKAFEVADPGLMSQALTHRSWIQENRSLVSEAGQRHYGTLATEGSVALPNLIRHHYVLHTLDASFRVPASTVISPAVSREVVAELFDRMPVAEAVLCSKGMSLTLEIKEDVTQAIVAAAWRANGDLLMERQPEPIAEWVRSFTAAPHPVNQLEMYCARIQAEYSVDFEERGPEHLSEYRATIVFDIDTRPRWRGGWRSTKISAKQSAADDVLSFLLGKKQSEFANSPEAGQTLLRLTLLAELRAIDPDHVHARKEIVAGRLGVDLLAAGAYSNFERWAQARSWLLRSSGSAVADRLTRYYEGVLKQQRREAVRHWIVEHLPSRGIEIADTAQRFHSWQESASPGRLSLLEELLPAIQDPDPTGTVLLYVELRAHDIAAQADLPLESVHSADETGQTLSLRLPGAELAAALEPVAKLVDSIVGGVAWAQEPQAVSVTLTPTPTLKDPVYRAGIEAVQRALQDPWLDQTHSALHSFLTLADRILNNTPNPTPDQLDELVSAEHSLLPQLRRVGPAVAPDPSKDTGEPQ